MKQEFERVLDLQQLFDPTSTRPMVERGNIIRSTIPEEMREWEAARLGAATPFAGRLAVQGKDGVGRKTFVPWVRIYSPELSPSAQNGWYVVYLFRADGAGVYLCLSHGSTFFDGFTFVPRPAEEMARLMRWARQLLQAEASDFGFGTEVDLATNVGVAAAYSATTAFAKYYPREAIPGDLELAGDAANAVSMLGLVYNAIENGRVPGMRNPDIDLAETALEEIANPFPARGSGQGFGLTAAQRRAVENCAMRQTRRWLATNGFTSITDVSGNKPYDFTAEKTGVTHVVEVKGTIGLAEAILVTKNEVAAHRQHYPNNILAVVSKIELNREKATATGGELSVNEQWNIDDCELIPLAYRCVL